MSFEDDDWEEWDGTSPFLHHCIAGSVAGLTEHGLVYPLDTVRTHIQVCAGCVRNPNFLNAASKLKTTGTTSSVTPSPSSTISSMMMKQQQHQYRAAVVNGLESSGGGAVVEAPPTGTLQTIRYLMSEPVAAASAASASAAARQAEAEATSATRSHNNINSNNTRGVTRLFRGIQTMIVGCIPAHALYFSTYEIIKASFLVTSPDGTSGGTITHLPWYGSMIAGAAASVGHDCVMTPLDTIKQRMQLGHYDGISQAFRSMVQQEGFISLFRSFPITLFANAPYGMIMVYVNEYLKEKWATMTTTHEGASMNKPSLSVTLMASSIAGFTASAFTTPLDRIKTSLQTQELIPACIVVPNNNKNSGNNVCPQQQQRASNLVVRNWHEALRKILREEGTVGLFRGIVPRVLSHTPAVAISWTSYETMKQILSRHFS